MSQAFIALQSAVASLHDERTAIVANIKSLLDQLDAEVSKLLDPDPATIATNLAVIQAEDQVAVADAVNTDPIFATPLTAVAADTGVGVLTNQTPPVIPADPVPATPPPAVDVPLDPPAAGLAAAS